MKIESLSKKKKKNTRKKKYLSIFQKLYNISELSLQQSFPKFIQLKGVTRLLFYIVGKIKVLEKCLKEKEKHRLLNTISISCKVSDTTIKDGEKLIQTVCCSGKDEKSLTETQVRLYRQMKTKTSQFLSHGEKSMLQAIKGVFYHVYYPSRVDKTVISDICCKMMAGLSTKRTRKIIHYGSLVLF